VSARHTVPTVGAYRDFARADGLMSYGSDLADAYRRVGVCAARILKGETPRDLPVTPRDIRNQSSLIRKIN
jgi:putative ABC transport system substrate-binding protein